MQIFTAFYQTKAPGSSLKLIRETQANLDRRYLIFSKQQHFMMQAFCAPESLEVDAWAETFIKRRAERPSERFEVVIGDGYLAEELADRCDLPYVSVYKEPLQPELGYLSPRQLAHQVKQIIHSIEKEKVVA